MNDQKLIYEAYKGGIYKNFKVGDKVVLITPARLYTSTLKKSMDVGGQVATILDISDSIAELEVDGNLFGTCSLTWIDLEATENIKKKFKPEDFNTAVDLLDI
jgi:hypothetical protein